MLVEKCCFDNSEVHYVTPRKLRFMCLKVKIYWRLNLSEGETWAWKGPQPFVLLWVLCHDGMWDKEGENPSAVTCCETLT